MWLSRYGRKWRTTSRRSPWEDEWSGKTLVILTGRACPWLSHPHQRRKSVLFSEPLEEDFTVISPPKDQPPPVLEEDDTGEIQEVPPLPEEQDSTIPGKTPADKLGPPHGPLRVVASSRKSGPMGTYKIHLLTVDHKAVGCGWQPNALKAQDLNPIDHQSDPHSYQECVRCFKLYDFPSDWPVEQAAQEEDSELSSSSADSLRLGRHSFGVGEGHSI